VYPQYVRSYLQERFGDGGHGFVHVAQPWRGYSHLEVAVDGFERWRTDHVQRRGGRDDGYYGLLGASVATGHPRAYGIVTPASNVVASRYEIYFLAQPKGGTFELLVDGQGRGEVSTQARSTGPGYHAIEVAEGAHTIEVRARGDGEVRLFGMTMERAASGVVVDTLGIRGTRVTNALAWDETVWADNLGRRAPDLVVLAFGTNEATDDGQPMTEYETRLRAVLERLARAAPQASCLLVGPGDFPDFGPDGSVLPRPRVTAIIEVQSRVAADAGCGFWDLRAFMGGELSMVQWVAADPPMAAADYVHLTRRGYVRMGMALVDAMMSDFDISDPLRDR
jgi:lysophospholipase L1-like esterase